MGPFAGYRGVALALLAVLFSSPCWGREGLVLAPPKVGIYLGGHPTSGPYDDQLTQEAIDRFLEDTGRRPVWMYVSWNWDGDSPFPSEACRLIHANRMIPFVGVMPWSTRVQNRREPKVTLDAIARGLYDPQLARAARAVRELGFPIMVSFGPEADGGWFPWSGRFNGGSRCDLYGDPKVPDGPERFRDAFRRFVEVFRANGAVDVTWVLHLAERPGPDLPWNQAVHYYPGDVWVDWVGVSLYGRLGVNPVRSMEELLSRAVPRLLEVSKGGKPLAVLEWNVADGPGVDKPRWVEEAFAAFARWEGRGLKGVAWWDKAMRPDGTPSWLDLRSSPHSAQVYRRWALTDLFAPEPTFVPRGSF